MKVTLIALTVFAFITLASGSASNSENTLFLDPEDTLFLDSENTLFLDSENRIFLDSENSLFLDSENSLFLNSEMDSKERKRLLNLLGDWVYRLAKSRSYSESSPYPGSLWITSLDGTWGSWEGQVVSLYYHPSKTHTATTVGRLGEKRSTAGPGQWAISYQTRGAFGNKCYYNTL
jgi:hypothetical protein